MRPAADVTERNVPRRRRKWLVLLVRVLVVGAIFYFIFASLWRNWSELIQHEFTLKWRSIALSLLMLGVYLLNRALIWHWITHKFACAISTPQALTAWFYSLLGKYVPGKVFMLAGRLHFYRQDKRGALRVGMCFMLETMCVLLAAILVVFVSPLFSPSALVARYRLPAVILIAVFFIAIRPRHLELLVNPVLRLLRRSPLAVPLRYSHVLVAVAMYTLNWTLLGAGFLLYVNAVYPVPIHYLVYLAGAFALATTVGILALFAPAGLGVREGVLMLGLSAIMPEAMAAVVTLGARVWMSVGELLAVGGVALVVTFRRRFAIPHGNSGEEPAPSQER